jgi:ADP-heptose:LPS heptosyltransferase
VESSDCVLAPDSSLTHIAGALEVPAVALYGPFPWQIRTAYCETTRALTRQEGFPCAPCHHHATIQKQFPDNCPTKAKGFCGVLDAIPPDQIIKAIEEQTAKFAKNVVQFEDYAKA